MIRRVGIINYGSGNFTSVYNAVRSLTADVCAVETAGDISAVSHLVLPGVGSFMAAMERLTIMDLVGPIRKAAIMGRPILGICVGMQVLAELGFEHGECRGLGVLAGDVRKVDSKGLRLPHIGWNDVEPIGDSILFAGMHRPIFYFVHSYHLIPRSPRIVSATCDYGESVVCAVSDGNIHGVQFHPEKSQGDGLALLRNFFSY